MKNIKAKSQDFGKEDGMKLSEIYKQELMMSFEQICEKCQTVGDLQKLNEEVRKLKED